MRIKYRPQTCERGVGRFRDHAGIRRGAHEAGITEPAGHHVQVQMVGYARAGGLADIVPEQLASHWQLTLDFLRIVTDFWPTILAEENCVDPALRRNRLLELQAEAWRTAPYLHDGSAATIRDVLTTRNPEGKHGKVDDLSEQQISDLCEYVLSL